MKMLLENEQYPPIEKTEFIKEYKSVELVYCPFFKKNIAFNAKALNHIFFKGSRSERFFEDSQTRMRLFKRAVVLLKTVTTVSGYFCDMRHAKNIQYWEFIAVIDNRRIAVVVRQLGNGEPHFWSVIPKWKTIEGSIVNTGGKIGDIAFK